MWETARSLDRSFDRLGGGEFFFFEDFSFFFEKFRRCYLEEVLVLQFAVRFIV